MPALLTRIVAAPKRIPDLGHAGVDLELGR